VFDELDKLKFEKKDGVLPKTFLSCKSLGVVIKPDVKTVLFLHYKC
jgi:hypothetical protein